MSKVRVHNFSVSLDGFAAGEGQSLETPFGHAGSRLVEWAMATRTFRRMGIPGPGEGSQGVDEAFASGWAEGIGVEIMGRNKFGHQRGPWDGGHADGGHGDGENGHGENGHGEQWNGWWGDDPVFHTPVVVLTHHPRPTVVMAGGTSFHFVDADPATALERARALAGGGDVRIGGGAATVRQFLAADLIDRMHLVLVPIVLGRGERLWDGLEGLEQRFRIEATPSPSGVVHLVFERRER